MRTGKKVRIENGVFTIVVKNPILKTDRRLKTLRVSKNIDLLLPGRCIAFGVPMRVDRVTVCK